MHKMERFLSWESPSKVVFCLRDACTLGYRTWKGLYQMSPRTVGDRRMVMWLKRLNAFLGDLTGLVFTSSVLELSGFGKISFSQLITEDSVSICWGLRLAEMLILQKGTSEDTGKSIFTIKKLNHSKYSGHLKKHTKLKNVTISALNLSVPHFILCKMKTNYFLS